MYKIFTLKILILLQILKIFAENKTDKIKALETEKFELLKQINEAIDDSIKVLKDGNDTESELGVNYMTKLKEQLVEINGTAYEDLKTNKTRRSGLLKLDVFDLAEVFKKNKKTKKKEEQDANTILVQQKIQQWILEREEEKRKIKEYKDRQRLDVRVEKCPRHGLGSKTSKNRRSGKKKKNTRRNYPCCRKCCKKSYMGCL